MIKCGYTLPSMLKILHAIFPKRTAWRLSGQHEIKVPIDLHTKLLACHLKVSGIGFYH